MAKERKSILPNGPQLGYQIVFMAFWISRAVFYWLGIRFTADSIVGELWQVADPALLRTDLWGVLTHLWTQPPLFNALIGTAMQQSPAHWPAVMHGLYLILGAVTAVTMYGLMFRLGVNHLLAIALCLVYIISPLSILYENWLFYEHPTMALLCLAALQVHQFLRSREAKYAFSLMFTLAALVLLRSMFHAVFMLGAVLLVLLYAYRRRQLVLLAAVIAFIPVGLWYAKTWRMTGTASGSGWSGMNLYKVAGRYLDEEDRKRLIAEGKISPVTQFTPFSRELQAYLDADSTLVAQPLAVHHPLLDDTTKSSGQVNFHHQGFIEVSKRYGEASRYIIRNYPLVYFKAVSAALLIFFEVPTRYYYLAPNLAHIKRYDQLYYGYTLELPGEKNIHYVSVTSLLLSIGVVWYALYWAIFRFRQQASRISRAQVGTIVFIAYTILYVSFIGISFEYGENMRFRVQIVPFSFVFAGLLLNRFVPARFRPAHKIAPIQS